MGKKVNTQWIRVHGPNLKPENELRQKKNASRLADKNFLAACEAAEVEPTKRQASKWNNRKGKAYAYKNA